MLCHNAKSVPSIPTFYFFFFNDTATTEIYTLSLHDALPISIASYNAFTAGIRRCLTPIVDAMCMAEGRSEEHTSELQSRLHLVCRLLLEKKKKTATRRAHARHDDAHSTPCYSPLGVVGRVRD